MKIRFIFLVSMVFLVFILSAAWGQDLQSRLESSRKVVKKFAAELTYHLDQALDDGGPSKAITVCAEIAPDIAFNFSKETGWDVSRTSLKFRNPANAPDEWETRVLKDFDKRKAAGEPVSKLEYHEVVGFGEKKQFRYMKAIPTKPVCLACHGKQISEDTEKMLDAYYPEDNARGFEVGNIRGAFTIVQPMQD